MRYALHDDPALDVRLRAKLTAQLPQQHAAISECTTARSAVHTPPSRFRCLVAAAIAAALLYGGGCSARL